VTGNAGILSHEQEGHTVGRTDRVDVNGEPVSVVCPVVILQFPEDTAQRLDLPHDLLMVGCIVAPGRPDLRRFTYRPTPARLSWRRDIRGRRSQMAIFKALVRVVAVALVLPVAYAGCSLRQPS